MMNLKSTYSKTPPYDHSEITTNPLLRPQFLGTKYVSTVIQWSRI